MQMCVCIRKEFRVYANKWYLRKYNRQSVRHSHSRNLLYRETFNNIPNSAICIKICNQEYKLLLIYFTKDQSSL